MQACRSHTTATSTSSSSSLRPAMALCHRRTPVCSSTSSTAAAAHGAPAPSSNTLLQRAQLLGAVARHMRGAAAPAPASPRTPQELREQLARGCSQMAAVLPLAAMSTTGFGLADLYMALAKAIDVFMFILTVRVLLSWFRNINWYGEPFRTLRSFTDPALNACRGIIPPIGGIDISPMLLFFGLSFAAKQLKILAFNA